MTHVDIQRVHRPGVGQKVRGHQAADAAHLAEEEAILVHVTVHKDDIARAEGQLHLFG